MDRISLGENLRSAVWSQCIALACVFIAGVDKKRCGVAAEELDNQFEVREAGNTDEYDLLELRSRSRDAEFERILLGLSGDVLVLMILEDAFGLRTEIRFDSVETNLTLDASLFEFTPPPGVDVIGAPSG